MKNKQRPFELRSEGFQSGTGCKLTWKTFCETLLVYYYICSNVAKSTNAKNAAKRLLMVDLVFLLFPPQSGLVPLNHTGLVKSCDSKHYAKQRFIFLLKKISTGSLSSEGQTVLGSAVQGCFWLSCWLVQGQPFITFSWSTELVGNFFFPSSLLWCFSVTTHWRRLSLPRKGWTSASGLKGYSCQSSRGQFSLSDTRDERLFIRQEMKVLAAGCPDLVVNEGKGLRVTLSRFVQTKVSTLWFGMTIILQLDELTHWWRNDWWMRTRSFWTSCLRNKLTNVHLQQLKVSVEKCFI